MTEQRQTVRWPTVSEAESNSGQNSRDSLVFGAVKLSVAVGLIKPTQSPIHTLAVTQPAPQNQCKNYSGQVGFSQFLFLILFAFFKKEAKHLGNSHKVEVTKNNINDSTHTHTSEIYNPWIPGHF